MTFPKTRPDFPLSSGEPQAGLCKNCKQPIKDEAAGFCDTKGSPLDWCWTEWCRKQDERTQLKTMLPGRPDKDVAPEHLAVSVRSIVDAEDEAILATIRATEAPKKKE